MNADEDLTPEGRLLRDLDEASAVSTGDPEVGHADADEALLQYVDAHVSTSQAHIIRQAFVAVRKWYG